MSVTIKHPFGALTTETVAVSSEAHTYKPTITKDCILYIKGEALGANSTVELTAATGLPAGTVVQMRWLSDGTARTLTVKPLIHANGQAFSATISKASTVTVMYAGGTTWLPIGHVASVEVS